MSDRRQRQKEARAAKKEAERKHESRRALFRTLGTALVFGLVVVAIVGFGGLVRWRRLPARVIRGLPQSDHRVRGYRTTR